MLVGEVQEILGGEEQEMLGGEEQEMLGGEVQEMLGGEVQEMPVAGGEGAAGEKERPGETCQLHQLRERSLWSSLPAWSRSNCCWPGRTHNSSHN